MTVENVLLGPGLQITRVVKGGWQLSGGHGAVDEEQAIEVMIDFARSGITTFDCADIYTGVEALIGRFLKVHRDRCGEESAREIRVLTKIVPDDDALAGLDRAYVERIVDRSLRRLGTERLDLVQLAWWDFAVPGYVELGLWLKELQAAGKIGHLGATNFDSARLGELLEAGVPIVSHQLQYSLLDNRPEGGMVDLCAGHDVGLLCYGALAGGFLTARWLGEPEPEAPLENRSLTKYKLIIDEFGGWALFQELLAALKSVAERHGVSIASVALRHVLERPGVAAAIVGARSADWLPETRGVFSFTLSGQDRGELNNVLARRKGPLGEVFGLERDRKGRHGRIMKYNLNREQES